MANPMVLSAGSALASLPSLVGRLIAAYENTKRIEFETRKLEVQGHLADRAMKLKRVELAQWHHERMQELGMASKALTKFLEGMEDQERKSCDNQKLLRTAFTNLMGKIVSDDISPEFRSQLMEYSMTILKQLEDIPDKSCRRLNSNLRECQGFLLNMAPRALTKQPMAELTNKEDE